MTQPDAYRMIRCRAAAVDIRTKIGNHSFRAAGITEYLRNGGKLEVAQQMANHESARTTGLSDRCTASGIVGWSGSDCDVRYDVARSGRHAACSVRAWDFRRVRDPRGGRLSMAARKIRLMRV